MMDEMWMRTWSEGHKGLCDDMGRGFTALAGAVARLRRRREGQVRARIGVPGRGL